jgi:4-amino-4-deoxy-L-arabinose transferase-like glycosyltransferase
LPWIGYLPIVMQNRRNFGDDSGVQVLLWSWLIGWTVLITLAGSKLATYLWPAFPPIAILAATAWNDLLGDSLVAAARKSFMRTFIFSSSTGPIVLPAAVYAVQKIYDVRFSPFTWAAVGVVALLTLVPLIPWRRGRIEASLALAALSLAGQFLVVMALILPQVAETCSARLLAEHFNRRSQMPARLFLVEGRIGSLVYYLDPEMRRQLTPDRIQQTLAKELPTFRPGDMIAIQEWKTPKLQKYLDVRQHPYTSIGVYRLYDAVSAAP